MCSPCQQDLSSQGSLAVPPGPPTLHCTLPIPATAPGQAAWGWQKPGNGEGVPAQGRGWKGMSFKVLTHPNHSGIPWFHENSSFPTFWLPWEVSPDLPCPRICPCSSGTGCAFGCAMALPSFLFLHSSPQGAGGAAEASLSTL